MEERIDWSRGGKAGPKGNRDRGQETLIGSLLVAMIVTIAFGVIGLQLLTTFQVDDDPVVDLQASATTTEVAVVHAGGDALQRDAVRVVVQNGSGERTEFTLAAATVEGDGDGLFEVGERAVHAHGFDSGIVRVFVTDTDAQAVLLDERVSIPA